MRIKRFAGIVAFAHIAAGPAEGQAPGTPAKPVVPVHSLFTADDYPEAAARAKQEGTVAARLQVDEQGRPVGCTITSSSGSSVLDSTTCRILIDRTKFTPAADATGRPVAGNYETRVTWRISANSPLDAATGVWVSCVMEAARRGSYAEKARDTVADEALGACAAEEARVATMLAAPREIRNAKEALDGFKQMLRASAIERVGLTRERIAYFLQTPEIEEPWPAAVPLEVLQSPDWTDFNIYPAEALRDEQEGAVGVELLIGKDGTPLRCRIWAPSGFQALDEGTCQLSMQMRFSPPVDANGKSVETHFNRRMIWKLMDGPVPFLASTLIAELPVERGRFAACQASGTGPMLRMWTASDCGFIRNHPDYFLGSNADRVTRARIEVSMLPAGSPASARAFQWGKLIASRRIEFQVSDNGAVGSCRMTVDRGFGEAAREHKTPCTAFLPRALEFTRAADKRPPRTGVLKIDVYAELD